MKRRRLTPLLWQFGEDSPSPARTFVLAPFGGGSAYALAEWLPGLLAQGESALALQYPGRGPRAGEPLAGLLTELAAQAAREVDVHTEGPLVLVGHSLGAVLSYEIAHRLEAAGRDLELLAVSAARPPDLQRLDPAAVLAMTRDDWLTELATGGNADVGEGALADIVDLMIPVLRADYLLLARYAPGPRRPVACPLLATGGADDPWVARAYLDAWQAWTTGAFTGRLLPGGHFYYRDRTDDFCRTVRDCLRPAADRVPAAGPRHGQEA
ncbi:thioesterase II family protein [Streptomyces sp. NPDC058385]|uniref:thioesterase II family protein n=1 Tax=Streptomyces sp. NPDC058385 TaxID=3346473 RepID=UPI0036481651